MHGSQIRGQAGGEGSGLWLPPTRPSRKSVQTQAVTGEAKIKVSSAFDVQQTHMGMLYSQLLGTSCPCIQVVGVGGGGSNAVNRMLANQLTGVEMYVMNTDAQVSPNTGSHPDCAPEDLCSTLSSFRVLTICYQ
jgi:hypothetical protein